MEFRLLSNMGWSKVDHSRDGIYWKLTPFGFNPGTELWLRRLGLDAFPLFT